MKIKRVALFIFSIITVIFAAVGICACAKNGEGKENLIFSHDNENWDNANGVYLGMVSNESCPAGEIDESKVAPKLEMQIGEEYYFIIDFTLQATEDNDGRGTVDVAVNITPAVTIDVTLQEASSGTYTENTTEDTKHINIPFSIPEKAEEVRGKRIVLRLKPLIASDYSVDISFEADKPIAGGLTEKSIKKTVSSQYTQLLKYTETDDGGLSVTAGTAATDITEIVIPYYKDGRYVTGIGFWAFRDFEGLTSITISDRVTSIGSSAFEGCSGLTTVSYEGGIAGWCGISGLANIMPYGTSYKSLYIEGKEITGELLIPDGVTSIGNSAFEGCSGLTSVTIVNGVTSIGDSAFYGCSGLTEITIPDSVTSIDRSAFGGCSGLTEIIIPDSVTSIGLGAFSGCSGLTNINIPDGVTYIGNSVFYGCSRLTSLTVPDGVTNIASRAFYGCSRLKSITIPDSVKYIGSETFYGCNSLVYNEYNNAYYLGNKDNPYVVLIKSKNKSIEECTINDKTKLISYSAFYNCSKLTSITIPDSVTSIGDGAFSYCNELTSVAIGSGVTSIRRQALVVTYVDSWAFYGCVGLTEITVAESNPVYHSAGNCLIETESKTLILGCKNSIIPSDGSVTSIGESAFCGCSSLTSIEIPDSVRIINREAFCECSGLTEITIPDSVIIIGTWAFDGCSSLADINFNGTKEQWNAIKKNDRWNENTGDYTVHCTDGDISK